MIKADKERNVNQNRVSGQESLPKWVLLSRNTFRRAVKIQSKIQKVKSELSAKIRVLQTRLTRMTKEEITWLLPPK